MRRFLPVLVASFIGSQTVCAGNLEKSFDKLDPEEVARQACIVAGMDQIKRDKTLPRVDRMKTSILSPAVRQGETLTGKGGAVRAKDRWYAVAFTCALTKDHKKATSFAYQLGDAIPPEKWEDLGLW